MPFTISYTDPRNNDLLPITNSENMSRAFTTAMPMLRLFVYRKEGQYTQRVLVSLMPAMCECGIVVLCMALPALH